MRGVIMETKNGRAVLLTKGGGFVNIKDKGYSIGDKVNITTNMGPLCAMAASLFIVCAGIGSYFVPAGYVSVDINPSLMMTLNPYNRVIDIQTFNDDARILLSKTDIKGRGAEESVEMLIKASEEIGYINDNNRDVILEVVPGMIRPDMERINHPNIEITNETADRETLRMSQNIGVSMAKVKAIEEYTEKNGGDIRSNAVKFNDKSAKEMRAIMRGDSYLPDIKPPEIPPPNPMPKEYAPKPPRPQINGVRDIKPHYNINSSTTPVIEQRSEKTIPDNQPPKNDYRPPENALTQTENKIPPLPPVLNEPQIWNIEPINNQIKIEEKPQDDNILPNKAINKPMHEVQPIHKEKNPQEKTPTQGDSKPEIPNSVEPVNIDNSFINSHPVKEEKPQDETLEQNKSNRENSDNTEKQSQKPENKFDGTENPSGPAEPDVPKYDNDRGNQSQIPDKQPDNSANQGKQQDNGSNPPPDGNMGGHNESREMP